MNELDYKKVFMAALGAKGYRTQPHEDKHSKFIADVSFSGNFIDGWVEVKYCGRVPPSLHSIEHWTKGQEDWLRERGNVGSGKCYLLVGTPRLHVLWHHGMLFRARHLPWEKAVQLAAVHKPDLQSLVEEFARLARIRG